MPAKASKGSVNFEDVRNDIKSAIGCFIDNCPSVNQIVLWGLCDAASAILLNADLDNRIKGIVLLNPWVRTLESESKAYVKHYYVRHILRWSFIKTQREKGSDYLKRRI